MSKSVHEEIRQFDQDIVTFLAGNNPKPVKPEEYIESAEFQILLNYLSGNKYQRSDLYNTTQWVSALYEYLPDNLKYMITTIKLLDSPMRDVEEYDKIVEEFHHNTNEIYKFALEFINEKNKGMSFYEPVQVSNVLKHLAIGLVAETNRYKYYKLHKRLKANIQL